MKRESLALAVICLLFGFSSLSTQAQVSFFQPPTYAGSGTVFVADFNGDGKPDILTSDGTMNLGNGDGTFTLGTPVSGTSYSMPVLAVADFNGDGKVDVLEQGTGTLLVLLGNGDGTFQAPISTASGASLSVVAAADLNGDGKADVVGIFNTSLMVYISKGDGTFASGVSYALGVTSKQGFPMILTLADFVGDKKIDVGVSVEVSTTAAQEIVLLGNGDGTFQAAKASASAYYPISIVAGDFNGDGRPDLAVSGYPGSTGPTVYILLGNGDGTFQAPTSAIADASVSTLAAADLNGDGKLDLVLTSSFVQIYLGNGDGTFSNVSNYVGNSNFLAPAIADFDLDGKPDIAYGDVVFMGNGDGTLTGIPTGVLPSPSSAVAGDFEKKGTQDIAAVSGNNDETVYILSNNGVGALSLAHTYTLQQSGYAIVTADFNGDGNLDLAVVGPNSAGNWAYSVLLGNSDGTFQAPVYYAQSVVANSGSNCCSVIVADFNNDHKLDMAVSLPRSQQVAVLLGNGDGTFAAPIYSYAAGALTLVSGDFNSDGNLDLAVDVTPTAILFGNGDGTFLPAVFPTSLSSFGGVEFSADFNGDGKPDLLSAQQLALGNGDGTFNVLPVLSGFLSAVGIADFNGDGKLDLAVSSNGTELGVQLGNGDGTFGPFITVPLPSLTSVPGFPLFTDMNGDSLADIVFPWLGGETGGTGVLLNTSPGGKPNFTINSATGSTTSETVSAGQEASFSLVVTPIASFVGTVNLSCAITPVVTPALTCTLSSSSVQISSSGTQTVTVKVGTTASVTSGVAPPVSFPPGPMPLIWTLMLLGSTWLWLRNRKRLPALAAPVMVLALAFSVGCGGSGSSSTHTTPGTPAGTYTATVTATSGSVSRNMALTVVVQ